MFGNKSFLSLFTIFAIAPAIAFSAPAAGKVRSKIGDVDRLKANQRDWAALRVGANIFQSDLVRTGLASEVIFGLPDGSTISIAENSEVAMSSLLQPNEEGGFETRLDIKKGHLNFAVHKLQDKNSKFQFKTGTATASIRGTEGYVGGDDVFFAGLKTGKLEIVPEGSSEPVSIVAGETVLGKESFVVVKLASSGNSRFAKKIEKLLAESKKPIKELVADVQKADSTFQEELKKEASDVASAVSANSFSVSTISPVEICDKGLLVEGFYKTSDDAASLVVTIGNDYSSGNLARAMDGNVHPFSHMVYINDENGLWTANKATVSFISGGVKTSKTIDLQVNKACQAVNSKAPTITLTSYDSLRCVANLTVGNMMNDAGIVTVATDGSQNSEEAIARNTQKRVPLKKGIHKYDFSVTDLAGNKAEASREMGCYPSKKFNVDVNGPAKEVLHFPPPPPQMDPVIAKTLQFQIRLPENDPSLLYKVVVKQNGVVVLQEIMDQIQSLDYQIPVELTEHSLLNYEIEVVHKSGYRVKARKVYEVKQDDN